MIQNNPAGQTWFRCMQSGQDAFRAGRLAHALDGFNRAVAVIDAQVDGVALDPALVMAKVASHLNRAATLARIGQVPQAEEDCRRAHGFVTAILHDPCLSPALRVTACCLRRMIRAERDQLLRRQARPVAGEAGTAAFGATRIHPGPGNDHVRH